MIDEVVGISIELEPSSLVDWECLLEIEVPVLISRSVDVVANTFLQIEGACRRLGKDRRAIRVGCGDVLVALLPWIPRKLLEDLRSSIHDPELSLGGIRTATEAANLANASVIIVRSDAARLPCLELRTATELPAANQLSSDRVLIAKERKGVEVIDDRHIASVVLRRAPEVGHVVGVRNDVAIVRTVVQALRPCVADTEHEVIGKVAVPTNLHCVVACTAVALLLLNGDRIPGTDGDS